MIIFGSSGIVTPLFIKLPLCQQPDSAWLIPYKLQGGSMTEDDLIEPYAVPEVFVDGFTKYSSRDGVMTCAGYRRMPDGNVVVVRLAWPVVNTVAAIEDAIVAMAGTVPVPQISSGAKRRAH